MIFTESLSFSAENADCILENLIRIKETVSEEEAYSEKADYKTNPFLYSFFLSNLYMNGKEKSNDRSRN